MSHGVEDAAAARETVIEALERSAEVYGLKRSYGRLYGLLFFAEEPMSLDELVAESDYAKSTVSTAMGALERFHLVRRRSRPGEGKKAFFEAETDFWRVFQELLDSEVRREIRIMSRALADAEEALAAADGDRAARDLKKVRRLKRVYDQCERFLDVMSSQSLDRIVGVLDRLR
jgi:DNA-binding transcriptional regulator GbsR (MarR family)